MLRWTYVIAGTILLGLVSFAVTASASDAVTVLWSLGAGALSLLFVRLIDSQSPDARSELTPMLMGGLAVGLGGSLKVLNGSSNVGWADAVGILAALGTAWGVDALTAGGARRRCFVCKEPLDSGSSFTCPRCHQVICTRPSCWAARHFRCRYCDEREVIIFPIDEKWWRARLGPRVSTGACSSCYKEAGEADLRECGRCGWPMCKRCWDYHNGRCAHCEWILPDLPASLKPFLGVTGPLARGSGEAARRRS
jgi:hypothetical protein